MKLIDYKMELIMYKQLKIKQKIQFQNNLIISTLLTLKNSKILKDLRRIRMIVYQQQLQCKIIQNKIINKTIIKNMTLQNPQFINKSTKII